MSINVVVFFFLGVTGAVLVDLSEPDLVEVGVKNKFHRRGLLAAIKVARN